MGKAILSKQKTRGRPFRGAESVHLRILPDQAAAIAAWIAKLAAEVTRPEAIRRLIELGLKIERSSKSASKAGRRSRAAELAAVAIEKLIDASATSDERDQRRRRLTKGPPEFREDRIDLPKAKK